MRVVQTLARPLHFRPDDPAGLTAIVPKYTMAAQAEKPAKPLFSARKTRMRCLITTYDRQTRIGRMGRAWYADGGGGPRLPTGGRWGDHAAARTAAGPAGWMPGGAMARACRPPNEAGGGAGRRARAGLPTPNEGVAYAQARAGR